MRQRTFRHAPRDEGGAVLVIVTLSLIALFGMMVLVVDVGSLLYTQRAMVNAADAAALAAAQSCGKKEGTSQAVLLAEFYAVENQSGVVLSGAPDFDPSCDASSGTVTVRLTTERPLFFAPVLGFGENAEVATSATAMWGGAGAGELVAPIMLSANRMSDCDIPPPEGVVDPQDCYFWWNNSNNGGHQEEDLQNAEWGTLDLLRWDVPTSTHCTSPNPTDMETWMLEGYPDPLPIDSALFGGTAGDGRTYVCRGQGMRGERFDNMVEDAIAAGSPLYFPVNDPPTQVDSGGVPCPPNSTTNCAVDKYNIIGFAKMWITEIWRGKHDSVEHCSHIPEAESDANARCMLVHWEQYTPEGLDPDGGENFGLVPVRLIA